MKTREQLEEMRAAFVVGLNAPCQCKGGHLFACYTGSLMIKSNIDLIDWFLGEGSEKTEKFFASFREHNQEKK